jgi:hypothetical protein
MRYNSAVYKTADSSTTLQMSNRAFVEHLEQLVVGMVVATFRTDGYKPAVTLILNNKTVNFKRKAEVN